MAEAYRQLRADGLVVVQDSDGRQVWTDPGEPAAARAAAEPAEAVGESVKDWDFEHLDAVHAELLPPVGAALGRGADRVGRAGRRRANRREGHVAVVGGLPFSRARA